MPLQGRNTHICTHSHVYCSVDDLAAATQQTTACMGGVSVGMGGWAVFFPAGRTHIIALIKTLCLHMCWSEIICQVPAGCDIYGQRFNKSCSQTNRIVDLI